MTRMFDRNALMANVLFLATMGFVFAIIAGFVG